MNEDQYRAYITRAGDAPSTISTKIASVKRIEREEAINLDSEFEKDKLAGLIEKFQYTMDDFRSGRPNPTRMRIEPDKIYRDLSFYRSVIKSYLKFLLSGDSDAEQSAPESADEMIAEDVSQTFALERDMQSAIRSNIGQMGQNLTIIDNGNETQVEAGYIDILAKDSLGHYVVIELKAGMCRAPAVAQILAYMGSIREQHGVEAKGILVAADFEKRVQLAAKAVPGLTLKRYSFRFEFSNLAS